MLFRSSLKLAREHDITSISFPSISTGVYRYPVEQAARIAIREIMTFLEHDKDMEKIQMVCFDEETFRVYEKAWKEYKKT